LPTQSPRIGQQPSPKAVISPRGELKQLEEKILKE